MKGFYVLQWVLIAFDVGDKEFSQQANGQELCAYDHQEDAQQQQWTFTEWTTKVLDPLHSQDQVDDEAKQHHCCAETPEKVQGFAAVT